jgi:hypothetical protein
VRVRLVATADDREHACVLARERTGGDSGNGGGADGVIGVAFITASTCPFVPS